LATLNAGSVAPRPPAALRKSLAQAAESPVTTSYSVFAWALENVVQRFADHHDMAPMLRELAQAGLVCAELVRATSAPANAHVRAGEPNVGAATGPIIIRPGGRDRAVEVIRGWIRRSAIGYIKIVDQFFGPPDLDLLRLVWVEDPQCRIQLLTRSYLINGYGRPVVPDGHGPDRPAVDDHRAVVRREAAA
jgi:hypothetical protein